MCVVCFVLGRQSMPPCPSNPPRPPPAHSALLVSPTVVGVGYFFCVNACAVYHAPCGTRVSGRVCVGSTHSRQPRPLEGGRGGALAAPRALDARGLGPTRPKAAGYLERERSMWRGVKLAIDCFKRASQSNVLLFIEALPSFVLVLWLLLACKFKNYSR